MPRSCFRDSADVLTSWAVCSLSILSWSAVLSLEFTRLSSCFKLVMLALAARVFSSFSELSWVATSWLEASSALVCLNSDVRLANSACRLASSRFRSVSSRSFCRDSVVEWRERESRLRPVGRRPRSEKSDRGGERERGTWSSSRMTRRVSCRCRWTRWSRYSREPCRKTRNTYTNMIAAVHYSPSKALSGQDPNGGQSGGGQGGDCLTSP